MSLIQLCCESKCPSVLYSSRMAAAAEGFMLMVLWWLSHLHLTSYRTSSRENESGYITGPAISDALFWDESDLSTNVTAVSHHVLCHKRPVCLEEPLAAVIKRKWAQMHQLGKSDRLPLTRAIMLRQQRFIHNFTHNLPRWTLSPPWRVQSKHYQANFAWLYINVWCEHMQVHN